MFKLAWSQLFAEKRRLLAAIAGIAFAVLLQLMQFGFRDALFVSSTLLHRNIAADLVVTSPQYEFVLSSGSITRRRLYQALALTEAESVAGVYVGAVPFKNIQTHEERRIIVIAFDPEKVIFNIPSIIAGAHYVKLPDVAIFDVGSLAHFGPVADEIRRHGVATTEIAGRRTRIVGLFELGPSFAGTGNLIVSDATFRRMLNRPEGVYEFGLVRLKPGSDAAAARNTLAAMLPNDVRVLTREQFVEVEKAYWDKASPVGFVFLMGLSVVLLVGAVIVYQILYTDVNDHIGEYATLKAMGYKDRYLYGVVLSQALILSVCGFPVGYGLAEIVYMLARRVTHLAMFMTVPRALTVFALTLATCGLAALSAMRRLQSADPAEIF